MSSLGWIETIQTAGFVFLIALCAWVALAGSFAERRKRVLQLAAYVIATHLAVGITQKDAWPITTNRLMHGWAGPSGELSLYTLYGVDGDGREWRIDPYAWKSISNWHLHFWFWVHFTRITPVQQQQTLAWLYGLAEEQRARLAKGDTSISPLGAASAPEWWMFQRQTHVPAEPYRAIRVYQETFNVEGAMAEAARPFSTITKSHLDRKFISEWKQQ